MTTTTGTPSEAKLVTECVSLVARYVEEVVLAHDFCPWAAPALRRGTVRTEVICDEISATFGISECAAALTDRLVRTAREVELVLLVLPRAEVGRLEFDRLLREVRERGGAESGELDFALAAFHPSARPDLRTPETLIPFLRRSPIPLIQAVRSSTLARVSSTDRGGTAFVDPKNVLAHLGEKAPVSLRERVARDNAASVARVGVDALERKLDALCADARSALDVLAPLHGGRADWR